MFALFLLLLLAFSASAQTIPARYKSDADKLIAAALQDEDGYAKLTWLCYRIGNRLSGSPGLKKAIEWSAEQMRKDGLSNVTVQPVKVPHWVRGAESAQMLAPFDKKLRILGLGMSVGTPGGGITAPVVAVSNFDELEKLGRDGVKGKIVLFNAKYEGYGRTVAYRAAGPSRAAALGAAAVLVRSVTSLAMQTPHTGSLSYDAAQPKIPAAAVSVEDAMFLASLVASGQRVEVKLNMEAHTEPDADSANVFAEIPGREKPEEVVVLGGHIDSWDVGQGAQDDGSGVIASLQAVALIKKLGLQPRRTIRVVFWTNEENGTRGGRAYREWVGDKIGNHVAAIEMDGGAERPRGFGYGGVRENRRTSASAVAPPKLNDNEAKSMELFRQIGTLLEPVGAGEMSEGGGGADIGPLTRDGVPAIGTRTVGTHYFDWHHTEADTLDKVDKEDFRKNIAALAVLSYVLADMPERLAGSTGPAAAH